MKYPIVSGITLLLLILMQPGGTVSVAAARFQDVKIDSSMTVDQLQVHASKGNAAAMLELGERLIQGRGVDRNGPEGVQWLQKAADGGKREAWYYLGVVYSNALGVEADMKKAIDFYRRGAELGDVNCQTGMGMVYQAGERIPGGVKADPAEARKWYRMAADQGHGEAILHLGQLLMFGQGGDADPVEGARWFRKGAELGSPEAQWSLGRCYLQGRGVPQDSVQAYALFAVAADGAENPRMKKGMEETRDGVGNALSPAQLAEAERLKDEWNARGPQ